MIKEMRNNIILKLLPKEKFFEEVISDDKKQMRNDQLIVMGWNMYRQELINLLKL